MKKKTYWIELPWNNIEHLPYYLREQLEHYREMKEDGKFYYSEKNLLKLIEYIYISEGLKK